MQLIDIRNEVLACGFDPVLFGINRINMYINNAYLNVVRRVNYYVDEATSDFTTTAGTALTALPADFGRVRSVHDTGRMVEMVAVGLRQIDRSSATSGAPAYYALDGSNLHLWPAPDQAYSMELRYWKIPAPLALDTDVPTLPADYHNMLVYAALGECYAAEDDSATAQYWSAKYDRSLAEFTADMKFPNGDAPTQISDMWAGSQSLGGRGWSIYGTGF